MKENPEKSHGLMDKLKKIIQSGFHGVIVIDTDNIIISGNQRKTALIQLIYQAGKIINP